MDKEEILKAKGCFESPKDIRDYNLNKVAGEKANIDIPDTYSLPIQAPVLFQGRIGSCVAHSISTALYYGLYKAGKKHINIYSRGFIYANRLDTDTQTEGMCTRQALKQLSHCGDVGYEEFPWNQKYPNVKEKLEKNKEQYLKDALPHVIKSYYKCTTNEDTKKALLIHGAVIITVSIYKGFGEEVKIPEKDEKPKGGHAMCLIGWDKTGWIVQNSWSLFWGKMGTCHIPYEYPIGEMWGVEVNSDVPDIEQTPNKEGTAKILYTITKVIAYIVLFFRRIIKK